MVRAVRCPICDALVAWIEANRHRPFCSERCRTIDLGAWASDRRVIPGGATADADDAPGTTPAEPR